MINEKIDDEKIITPDDLIENEDGEYTYEEIRKTLDQIGEDVQDAEEEKIYGAYAEMYFDHGIKAYPAKGKAPLPLTEQGGRTKHLLPQEKVMRSTVTEWGYKFPSANIWGSIPEGIIILDVENLNGQKILDQIGISDQGPIALSPGGDGKYNSKHIYFRIPKGEEYKTASVPGIIETSCGNNKKYLGIMMPPSKHPVSNLQYKWKEENPLIDIDKIPELPKEKYDLLIQEIYRVNGKPVPPAPIEKPLSYERKMRHGTIDLDKLLTEKKVRYERVIEDERIIYKLYECFFTKDHEKPDGLGHGSIFQNRKTGMVTYFCFHDHCKNSRTWEDVKKALSLSQEDLKQYSRKLPPFTLENYLKVELSGEYLSEMDIPEPNRIISPWLEEASINLLIGDRGIGKTNMILGMCKSIISGKHFGKWEITTSVDIVYIDGELPLSKIRKRMTKFDLLLPGETGKKIHLVSNSWLYPYLGKLNLRKYQHREFIKELCDYKNAKLIIFDNKSTLFGGEENTPEAQDEFNDFLFDLRFMGVSSIVLCHTTKQAGKLGSKTPITARGSYKQEDPCDTIMTMEYPKDYEITDRCRFIVRFSKERNIETREESKLIAPAELSLVDAEFSETGETYFHMKDVSSEDNKKYVLKGMSDGKEIDEIATELNIGVGSAQNIRTKLSKEGLVTYKNRKWEMTEKGEQEINKMKEKGAVIDQTW